MSRQWPSIASPTRTCCERKFVSLFAVAEVSVNVKLRTERGRGRERRRERGRGDKGIRVMNWRHMHGWASVG